MVLEIIKDETIARTIQNEVETGFSACIDQKVGHPIRSFFRDPVTEELLATVTGRMQKETHVRHV